METAIWTAAEFANYVKPTLRADSREIGYRWSPTRTQFAHLGSLQKMYAHSPGSGGQVGDPHARMVGAEP